jgi:hypothetical protein
MQETSFGIFSNFVEHLPLDQNNLAHLKGSLTSIDFAFTSMTAQRLKTDGLGRTLPFFQRKLLR